MTLIPLWRRPLALLCASASIMIAQGATPARAAEWTDPAGDVTSPNADIVSGSATIAARMVDLRVRFLATPFPPTNTQGVLWYFDTDQNVSTTNPYLQNHPGADLFLLIDGPVGQVSRAIGIEGIDLCLSGSLDPATNTLRFFFPATLLQGISEFNYVVRSDFGGSFGRNEQAPDFFDFGAPGGFFGSDADPAPPFQGIPLCTPYVENPVLIDIRPNNSRNTLTSDGHALVRVAVLSHGGFDAPADVDPSSVKFGWSGQEPSLVGCDDTAGDVDGDGLTDLVCTFRADRAGFEPGDTLGVLRGQTFNGDFIRGSDQVEIVGGGH